MKFFSISKYNSFIVYIKNGWNQLDIIGILIFIIGFCIHLISHFIKGECEIYKETMHEIAK